MTDDLRLTDEERRRAVTQWRLLHSFVVDAVVAQDEPISRAIQQLMGGMSLRSFGDAVTEGSRVRIRPLRDDDGSIRFRPEVRGEDGAWHGLCRPPAHMLGMSQDEAEAALTDWFTRFPDGLEADA